MFASRRHPNLFCHDPTKAMADENYRPLYLLDYSVSVMVPLFMHLMMVMKYLFCPPKIYKLGEQLRRDDPQALITCKVSKVGVVAIGHSPDVWNGFWEQIPHPHHPASLVRPCC
jgi:hypothetical protein